MKEKMRKNMNNTHLSKSECCDCGHSQWLHKIQPDEHGRTPCTLCTCLRITLPMAESTPPKPLETPQEATGTSCEVFIPLGSPGISWERPAPGTRPDIVGVRHLDDGSTEYLMHNEALCDPYYVGRSPYAEPKPAPQAEGAEFTVLYHPEIIGGFVWEHVARQAIAAAQAPLLQRIAEMEAEIGGLNLSNKGILRTGTQMLEKAEARIAELEAQLEAKDGHKLYVWQRRQQFVAMAHATNVSEARQAIWDEDGTVDESVPIRREMHKMVQEQMPVIFRGTVAYAVLTDSAELEESDAYRETQSKRIKELEARIAELESSQSKAEKVEER